MEINTKYNDNYTHVYACIAMWFVVWFWYWSNSQQKSTIYCRCYYGPQLQHGSETLKKLISHKKFYRKHTTVIYSDTSICNGDQIKPQQL